MTAFRRPSFCRPAFRPVQRTRRITPPAAALCLLISSAALSAQAPAGPDALHAWYGQDSPAQLEAWVSARLAEEQQDIAGLLAVQGPRTVDNTLAPFDAAANQLSLAGQEAGLLYAVGDEAALRDKAQALAEKVSSAATDLSLNPRVYQALSAVHAESADPATRHYLDRQLLEYRLSGVDRDDATRQKIRQIQDRITALQLTFGRNVQEDVRKVQATRDQLDGLPQDYINRHKPDPQGLYTLTTDSPDVIPVFSYAKSAELRRRVYLAYHDRAFPANEQVLRNLLTAREDLAHTLGYKTYADLATADQMIGSSANVQKLLNQVAQVSQEAAKREYSMLLAFAQKQQPGVVISDADAGYWSEQYRRTAYDFDSQSVRPYFPYAEVQTGILQTAGRLFHVQFKPAADALVWDRSVSAFDVYDGQKRIGRIYLDMHPRAGKDKWFSNFPIVPGMGQRQLPEAALICNFPGGEPGDPGLMQYSDVVTFFHEFGHLMHYVLGSQGRWSGAGSFSVEGDFVEAPSQMLEEFFRSPALLQSFARNYKTGEVIPTAVVERMDRAAAYGRGQDWANQVLYATYALQLHEDDPAKIDFTALYKEDSQRLRPYQWVDGNHMFASFTHLSGYASNYYTYVLDKVIALDFYSQFDPSHLLDGPTAMRYRRAVLEPGATKPAAELVRDFLGRPQSVDAFRAWINAEFQPESATQMQSGH